MHFIVFEGQKSITLCLLYRFAWLKICSIEMISVFHIFNTNILKCLKVSNVDGDYLLMMLYIRQLQMLNVRTVDII